MTAAQSRRAKPAGSTLPRIDRSGQEILAAILQAAGDEESLTVQVSDEVEFEVGWRPLGWAAKSRAVSAATEYVSDKNPQTGADIVRAVFHLDVFKKKALLEMVTRCPFTLSESVIEKFPEHVGAQFDAIIPDPFSSTEVPTMGKDTGSSS